MGRIDKRIFALFFLIAALGCGPSYELVSKSKIEAGGSKSYFIRNYTVEVMDYPSGSSPEITVRVQRQKFWIETAKGVKQKYKKYSDGKLEPEPGTREEKQLARITGKTEWVPAPNETVVFAVTSEGRSASSTTDEAGIARFDVSGYAEDWIEGRDLVLEVKAQLAEIVDPEAWDKAKNKHPGDNTVKEILKTQEREFFTPVTVRARVLQSIFERR